MPADEESSLVTPEIPWKATGIVALATFCENKSWPRWEGKAGNVEFTKQNEAFPEKDSSAVLNCETSHCSLRAVLKVIFKSWADLSYYFHSLNSQHFSPEEQVYNPAHSGAGKQNSWLLQGCAPCTREPELTMRRGRSWRFLTWKQHPKTTGP